MSEAFTLLHPDPPPPPMAAQQQEAARQEHQRNALNGLVMFALRALSQRFVAALLNLFGLVTLLSALWLFMHISAEPSTNQLILAGLYALLVAALNHMTRKKAYEPKG